MAAANVVPQTEVAVMMAALEKDWNQVQAAMVGDPQHPVAMSQHYQAMVLSEALGENEWTFLDSVVTGGFPFMPNVLDNVLESAINANKMEIASDILLSPKRYKLDPGLVLRAMRIFCMRPDWLQTAYELAKVFPSDISPVSLGNFVYLPLQVAYPNGNVIAQLIVDLLEARFTMTNGSGHTYG